MRGRFSYKTSEIARIIKGKLIGSDLKVVDIALPGADAKGKIVFLFGGAEYSGNATCLVVRGKIDHTAVQIISRDPKYALYLLLTKLSKEKKNVCETRIDRDVEVAPSVVIKRGVVIRSHAKIGPCAIIGGDVEIGKNSIVGAHSVINTGRIGSNVRIGAGCIIGQPGFGFIKRGKRLLRFPHIGQVTIGDNVEVGSNCVIDRGTFSDTVIGAGTKIDSLVHIAHNVKIGRGCVIIAQSGIAGSSEIGEDVFVAGQAGIKEGVRIGAGSQILAKAGVFKSFPPRSIISGIPAREHKEILRVLAKLFKKT